MRSNCSQEIKEVKDYTGARIGLNIGRDETSKSIGIEVGVCSC